MIEKKERVTVTVDASLLVAGQRAVKEGRAESLSQWVNQALVDRKDKEARLVAMAESVADYEKRFGVISVEEIAAQQRWDRGAAVVVRGPRRARPRRNAPRRKSA
jgi:hypothetical protein